jgi:N-acetylmuramoyl-L-alanine amidase
MSDLAIIEQPSPNHDERPPGQAIDLLLLHYTGMRSGAAALERLRDSVAKVSAHYLVEEDGRIFQLVSESRRAWHAGAASWQGATDVNARSLGIEIVNPGHEFGYRPFPPQQMAAVKLLALDILARHPIPAARVLGHSDVAPLRKEDPGELFDWRGLAAAGIGLWPEGGSAAVLESAVAKALTRIGYGYAEEDLAAVVRAFQRHFRPNAITGVADAETRRRMAAVLAVID